MQAERAGPRRAKGLRMDARRAETWRSQGLVYDSRTQVGGQAQSRSHVNRYRLRDNTVAKGPAK